MGKTIACFLVTEVCEMNSDSTSALPCSNGHPDTFRTSALAEPVRADFGPAFVVEMVRLSLDPSCGSNPARLALPLGRLSVVDVVRGIMGTSNGVDLGRSVRLLTRAQVVVREIVRVNLPVAQKPGVVRAMFSPIRELDEVRLALFLPRELDEIQMTPL